MSALLFSDSLSEVWHGDALNAEHVVQVMGDRVASALIFDAPYSDKTHAGHKAGKLTADRAAAFAAAHADSPTPESRYSARKSEAGESGRRDLDYESFCEEKIEAFCDLWLPRCDGWCASIADDVLAPVWSEAFRKRDLYCFCPLPLVETGSRVRMTGDGPSNWTCWVVVARPKTREFASWGTLPGAYVQPAERDINSRGGSDRIVGGKPIRSMRAIVRDYSKPGDLVVDPFCGGGTTVMAAKFEGRRGVGIEIDRDRAHLSARLVAETKHQASLFGGAA